MSTRISLASLASTLGEPLSSSSAVGHPVGLAGSIINSRYRANAVAAVQRDAIVYSAEDIRRGWPIALKVLRGEFARDADFVAAVRAQARTLARSAHVLRGVQRVYECGETEAGQLFVALEWLEGGTLCDVLDAGGALAAPTALRVVIRVGEALEALHHTRLVHGSLGPDSVVMVKDGERVRLVGAEMASAYRTATGRGVRDPFPLAYQAPEQAEGGEPTEATDVYALGMLLRHLLTPGRPDDTAGAAPPPLSPALERIIATALEARPERRYPDMTVMVNDIWGAAAVAPEPESRPRPARGRTPLRRRMRPRRRPFALRTAAAMAVAGIAAAIVWVAAPDRLASLLSSRTTPPAVTTLRIEPGVLPSSDMPAPIPVVPEAPPAPATASHPAPSALVRPAIGSRPRAKVESAAPVAPRAPVVSRTVPEPRRSERDADMADGSAAIDWLLTNRR